MDRNQRSCLVTSLTVHGTLLLAIFLLPGFMHRQEPPAEILPPLELIDTSGLRLSVNQPSGGGTPPVRTETPAVPPPEPPARQLPPPEPVREPRVEPRQEPVPEPRPEPEPRTPPPPVRVNPEVIRAQETDPKLAPPKESKPNKKPTIQISREIKRASPEDRRAERERERRREEAAADRRAAAEAARRQAALSGLRNQLAERLTGETDVQVPGPGGGGSAWLNYADYLKSFYEARWVRPQSLSAPVAYVGVAITVSRSGTLRDFKIIDPSGIREMDASVRAVLGKYRSLAPLPSDTSDTERTFRIRFKLEGTPSA